MSLFRQLYIQVLLGVLAAIVVGLALPDVAVKMKPLGDAFIALLRMMLAPIIFCSVVLGLTQVANMRQLGRLALKALIYFEVATTLAMILGFVAVNVFRPGDGLHAADLEITENVARATASAQQFTIVRFLLSIIPTTLVDAFAKGEILQVLFISILTGVALSVGGVREDSLVIRIITEGQTILFRILGFLMRLAPIGAFGALAAAIGAFGAETFISLAKLVALMWATCIIFIVVFMQAMAMFVGMSIFKIIQLIRDELLILLGTASGEVVLPRMLRKLEAAGCDKSVVGFTLPAGYSFNLDGTSIYMAVCAGFIAQATDTPFPIGDQIAMLAVMLFTSKGGSTVAGGAFVKLAATMQTVPTLPLGGLGIIFGIDRLLATALSLTNLIGNALAVFVVAKWEGAFSREKFDHYLARQAAGEIDASGAEKL